MKRTMKLKKKLLRCTMVFLLVALAAFNYTYAKSKQICELHPVIDEILAANSLKNNIIREKASYKAIHYKLVTPEVTKKEIEEYVDFLKMKSGINEITEEWVKETFDIGSIEQFYSFVEEKLLNQKKVESVFEARRIVLDQLLEKFQFELDEKEISEYSIEFVRAYEVEAALYDMSLEEYYQEILQVSTDEFFEECYKECEKLVKTYLVIGAIANIEFEEIKLNDKSKVYSEYQSLENRVYSLFINAEKNF